MWGGEDTNDCCPILKSRYSPLIFRTITLITYTTTTSTTTTTFIIIVTTFIVIITVIIISIIISIFANVMLICHQYIRIITSITISVSNMSMLVRCLWVWWSYMQVLATALRNYQQLHHSVYYCYNCCYY
jgi:hypothetical protein